MTWTSRGAGHRRCPARAEADRPVPRGGEDKKADYLFTAVKDNQPSLFAAVDALDWENTSVTQVMRDRGHGRDETRILQVLPAPEGLFPHAAQAFLIERAVRDPHDGQLRSAAAALGITSRSRARGGTPEVIAAAARGHWDIEACIMCATLRWTRTRNDCELAHPPGSWPPSATPPSLHCI
jgi:hypothetical protein